MPIYDYDGNSIVSKYWNNKINFPYWILHLDCGRKYFTVANVKLIVDAMANANMNQLEFHFSENSGFRLELDDMTVTANGTTYNLTPCLGGSESPTMWYKQSDMDEIIEYAQKKGIDIVPSFDMPSHMDRILTSFTQFQYNSSARTLDITNPRAVNFAKALAEKYATYFANKGCKYYSFGFDELNGYGVGFPQWYANGDFQYVVDFANTIAQTIKACGMIPRAFNEIFFYSNDPSYYADRDIEVLYWDGQVPNETLALPLTLMNRGYTVINSNEQYYWVNNSNRQVTSARLESANLLTDFDNSTPTKNANGAMFCVWCDYKSDASDNGDGGTAVVTAITPLIASFGVAVANALGVSIPW